VAGLLRRPGRSPGFPESRWWREKDISPEVARHEGENPNAQHRTFNLERRTWEEREIEGFDEALADTPAEDFLVTGTIERQRREKDPTEVDPLLPETVD